MASLQKLFLQDPRELTLIFLLKRVLCQSLSPAPTLAHFIQWNGNLTPVSRLDDSTLVRTAPR